MNRATTFFLFFLCSYDRTTAFTKQPNIVILIVDDMGWNDVGFHGSNQVPTPNIDAMAYNGVILNRHYVQQTCSPSRSALLTGRYPIHTGMQGIPILHGEPNGLPLDLKILPQYLKDLGYKTHLVGKWHQGFYKKAYTPLHRGFDSFFGHYTGYMSYYDYMTSLQSDGVEYFGLDIRRNETPAWDLVGTYSTDVFTGEATEIIRSHSETEPLFLYMSYNAVHAGNKGRLLVAPEDRINNFQYIMNPNRRIYAAMLSKLDDSVGCIIEALDEKGILNNTIILFLADNGAPAALGDYFVNWGSNFPLRGTKDTLWEGGIRSASFIWSPELQKRPRMSDDLIHISDWVPTFYSAAGGNLCDLPEGLDGVNQWNTLLGDMPSERKDLLVNIDEVRGNSALIYKDKRGTTWKLHNGTVYNGDFDGVFNDLRSSRNPKYDFSLVRRSRAFQTLKRNYLTPSENYMRLLRNSATVTCSHEKTSPADSPKCVERPCLFDLGVDPCEKDDVAEANSGVLRRLVGRLQAYSESLVPQSNKPVDYARSNPKYFNYTFSPWL